MVMHNGAMPRHLVRQRVSQRTGGVVCGRQALADPAPWPTPRLGNGHRTGLASNQSQKRFFWGSPDFRPKIFS